MRPCRWAPARGRRAEVDRSLSVLRDLRNIRAVLSSEYLNTRMPPGYCAWDRDGWGGRGAEVAGGKPFVTYPA
jgi:hypothetical protein